MILRSVVARDLIAKASLGDLAANISGALGRSRTSRCDTSSPMVIASVRRNVREALLREGFAFLPKLMPGAPTLEVAALFGDPDFACHTEVVQSLRVRKLSEAPPNTYSGAYGADVFPLHSDLAHWHLPPRYFLLRCLVGSPVVPTYLLRAKGVVASVGKSALARGLMRPRRPHEGKLPLLSLYQSRDHDWLVRWDQRFIVPASQLGAEARDAVLRSISNLFADEFYLAHEGDTLFVDNWHVLHGRGPVPPNAHGRIVERCYLEKMV